MAKIIGLPKLSPTMEEGTLVRWVKAEGEPIEVDDLLAEVETDKATMEFRSFDRGVLLKILAAEGESLRPDTPVAIVGRQGEDIDELLAEAARRLRAAAGAAGGPAVAGAVAESQGVPQPGAPPPAAPGAEAALAGPADPAPAAGRLLASPLVRRLARERGVDLAGIRGSGPRGRIVKRDLDAAPTGPAALLDARPGQPYERLPPLAERASATRRTIARRLVESKQQIPHYYLTIDLDAAALVATRAALNDELGLGRPGAPPKLSLNDFILKACAATLRRHPQVNSSWIDGVLHTHRVVDLSVAVAIPEGLVTPVVRDADRKGLLEIGAEVRELATQARERRLRPEQMRGGTFSVSNLGMYGLESFTAVINPPEAAILAVGAVRDEPVVERGAVVPGKRLRLTLSCDHRVIDGAVGAAFLATLRRMLETPALMLAL